jgi:hypothetical protein
MAEKPFTDRIAMESILGGLPDNIYESELQYLHALTDFVQLGDYKRVKAIPEDKLRLLRVKFTSFSGGNRYKDLNTSKWIPSDQLLAAMDLRLQQIDRRAGKIEKVSYFVAGAIVALVAAALRSGAIG